MSKNTEALENVTPPSSVWESMAVHVILFPTTSGIASAYDLWKGLTGEDPQKTERKNGEVRASGLFRGQNLTLISDHNKLVWVATPVPDFDDIDEMDTLGNINQALQVFLDYIKPWVTKSCPEILRIGLGGKVIQFTDTTEVGRETLSGLLPDVKVSSEIYDFSYRVNRKRNSAVGVENMHINRLVTWSYAKMVVSRMEVSGQGVDAKNTSEREGCMVDFDINTPPERKLPIPADKVIALIDELSHIAIDVIERGDRR